MKLLIKKILIIFCLIIVCIVGFTFLDISNDYICIKFQKTQYHKISWFLQRIDNGGFKKKKYKAVFLGSSQCYYGINDSILGKEFINLGMNTPSRDLDLYMKERFILGGGKSDNYIVVIGGGKVVSYGIHPLMPYLVKPSWFFASGQSLWTVHFGKYLIKRFQIVYDYISWQFFRKHEPIIVYTREFGVGYLDRITKIKQVKSNNNQSSEHDPYLNKNCMNLLDEFLHNTKSQWGFFERNEKMVKNRYLVILGFQSFKSLTQDLQNIQKANVKLLHLDYRQFENLISDSINWADQGHLNRDGSANFTKQLKNIKFFHEN